jgi:hypothetical protein
MRLVTTAVASAIIIPLMSLVAHGQSPVPRLITLSGVLRPADSDPIAVAETVTFAVYAQETGGTPIWEETQTLKPDASGRYSVLLGATQPDGVPLSVFASGEARWLGMTWARSDASQARSRLTFVPYAVHAVDADTLGGKPATAYALISSNGSAAEPSASNDPAPTPNAILPGGTNQLAKYVNGTDVTPSTISESGGQAGIGTTTPLDTLHVRFSNTDGSLTGYAVQNLGNTATSYSGMLFYDQTGRLAQFQGFNNVTHEYRINNIAGAVGCGPASLFLCNGSISFLTGNTRRFFVQLGDTGNIAIGSPLQPAASLELANAESTNPSANLVSTTYGNSSAGSQFNGRKARGTSAGPGAVLNGDTLASFGGESIGLSFFQIRAAMILQTKENWTDTAQGTSMAFRTTGVGSSTTSPVMSIGPGGNVGIDMPLDGNGNAMPALDRLQVFGDVRIGMSGANGCLKDFNGTGIVGACSSDRRLKRLITPFGPSLEPLATIQPVHYFWREAEFPGRHLGTGLATGLIAQDVEQVLPELVETQSDGFKAVNYSRLPLVTIQAIRELTSRNDELKRRLTELERRLNELLAGKR